MQITMHQANHIKSPSDDEPCHGCDSNPEDTKFLHDARLSADIRTYVLQQLLEHKTARAQQIVDSK